MDSIREIHEIRMTTHKEEKDGRMKADLIDKVKLQNVLETRLYPLNCSNHPESTLWNIYTGQLLGIKVNANKLVEIGTKQMVSFQKSLPDGFRSTIKKEFVTVKQTGKSGTKNKTIEVYNADHFLKRHVFVAPWSYSVGGSFQV